LNGDLLMLQRRSCKQYFFVVTHCTSVSLFVARLTCPAAFIRS
jgi:hypothetical protein